MTLKPCKAASVGLMVSLEIVVFENSMLYLVANCLEGSFLVAWYLKIVTYYSAWFLRTELAGEIKK